MIISEHSLRPTLSYCTIQSPLQSFTNSCCSCGGSFLRKYRPCWAKAILWPSRGCESQLLMEVHLHCSDHTIQESRSWPCSKDASSHYISTLSNLSEQKSYHKHLQTKPYAIHSPTWSSWSKTSPHRSSVWWSTYSQASSRSKQCVTFQTQMRRRYLLRQMQLSGYVMPVWRPVPSLKVQIQLKIRSILIQP